MFSHRFLLIYFFCLPFWAESQCLSGNCFQGIGKYQYENGAVYDGHFQQGKIHGYGTLYFSNGNKYQGQWVNHIREGNGTFLAKDGTYYSGEFIRNKMHGKGQISYPNKDSYKGDFAENLPHGSGEYLFSDGDKYLGSFSEGKFDGEGIMFYANGAKYSGLWRSNKKNGFGVFVDINGKEKSGDWVDGLFVDPSSTTNSPRIESNQKLNSKDKEYHYPDGTKYIGPLVNGRPEGNSTVYYADGNKYVGEWKHHGPSGNGTFYFQEGRVISGTWEGGKLVKEKTEESKLEYYSSSHSEMDINPKVKIWAVVVGVARYSVLPSLKYTDDDAFYIYAHLKSPDGGALPDDQIRLHIDDEATESKIIESLKYITSKADQNDVIMMYFSGHGLPGKFLPIDFNGYQNILRHDDIKKLFENSAAKHKIIMADACHAGSLIAAKGVDGYAPSGKLYTEFINTNGGTAMLVSSKSEEVSLEDLGIRHGVFSYYLIKGLKGEADQNSNGIVSFQELSQYVITNVKKHTGGIQSPLVSGDYDSNMPMAVLNK
jgi:hypothetical protein